MPLKKFDIELYYHAVVFNLTEFSYEKTEDFLVKYGFEEYYTHHFVGDELVYIQTPIHRFHSFTLQKLSVQNYNGVYVWVGQIMG